MHTMAANGFPLDETCSCKVEQLIPVQDVYQVWLGIVQAGLGQPNPADVFVARLHKEGIL